jgi:hypothetical protein
MHAHLILYEGRLALIWPFTAPYHKLALWWQPTTTSINSTCMPPCPVVLPKSHQQPCGL